MLVEKNLVDQVHECKVMLGWVSTIFFPPRNLLSYNASKIVKIRLSALPYIKMGWNFTRNGRVASIYSCGGIFPIVILLQVNNSAMLCPGL